MGPWQPPLLDSAQVEPLRYQQIAFIGDVHGYLGRLDYLMAKLSDAGAQHLVFLGDLIDRGPRSRQVVARVREMVESGQASAIIGNHEYALVRGLGLPEAGIPGNVQLLQAWYERYGGDATAASYGITGLTDSFAQVLRQAVADDLDFLASLPWYLWGVAGDDPWLAVHAGLDERAVVEQLSECAPHQRWLRQDLPRFLYAKDRQHSRSHDLDRAVCVVSGHTPQDQPLVTAQRILADTSGGRPGRPLSAVLWPSGRVFSTPASLSELGNDS